VIEIIVLAVAAFVATHIDEAFVLVAFFTDPRLKRADVFVGQFLGMSVIVAIALTLALLSLAIPYRYIGYLGLLPILIGVKSLWLARRPRRISGARPRRWTLGVPTAATTSPSMCRSSRGTRFRRSS